MTVRTLASISVLLMLVNWTYGVSLIRPVVFGDVFCGEETSVATKKLNESCNSTIECANFFGPVICSDKKICDCAPGFYQTKESDRPAFDRFSQVFGTTLGQASGADDEDYACRPLPSLYQPCTTRCMAPLQCVGDEGESFESSTTETGHLQTTPFSQTGTGTTPSMTITTEETSFTGDTTPVSGSTNGEKTTVTPTTSEMPIEGTSEAGSNGTSLSTTEMPGGETTGSGQSTSGSTPTSTSELPEETTGPGNTGTGSSTTPVPSTELPGMQNGTESTPQGRSMSGDHDRVHKDFPIGPGDGPWVRPWNPRQRAGKTCRCMPPYQLMNFQCQLKCSESEFYVDGKCHRRCKEDEVRLANFDCKPRVGLGESCDGDEQCTAAFSGCIDGKCTCRPGFKSGGKGCTAEVAHCEFGEPLRGGGGTGGGGLVQCTYTGHAFDTSRLLKDTGLDEALSSARVITISTAGLQESSFQEDAPDEKNACPSDHFCHPFENPVTTRSTSGFCCPIQKKVCPVGEAHPTANCSGQLNVATLLSPQGLQGAQAEGCPQKTHYCYQRLGSVWGPVCCPRACPRGLVLSSDGQCLVMAEIGGKCQSSEQCGGNSVCQNGACTCPNRTILVENPSRRYCSAQCDPSTEINYNNKCYSRKKLGDPCRGQEFRCPITAYCGSKGLCQCPCGRVQINDTLCAAPPHCPQKGTGDSPNPFNAGGDLGSFFNGVFSGDGWGSDGRQWPSNDRREGRRRPTNQASPNRRSPAEIYANATLCRVNGQKAPADRAVDQCPGDQLCLRYLDDMGVCCPRPEPFCPNGARPLGSCSPTTATEDCDANSVCFQYITPANRVSKEGRVCCPSIRFGPIPPIGVVFQPVLGDQAEDP